MGINDDYTNGNQQHNTCTMYITHGVHFHTIRVYLYSVNNVHISHFQKCYFNSRMEGVIYTFQEC